MKTYPAYAPGTQLIVTLHCENCGLVVKGVILTVNPDETVSVSYGKGNWKHGEGCEQPRKWRAD